MTQEGRSQTSSQKNGKNKNIALIIAIVLLSIVIVVLLVIIADAVTTDESEPGDNQTPIGGTSPGPDDPQVTARTNVNVRAGPGTNYDIYGVMQAGQSAHVVGVCNDQSWWAIRIPVDPQYGWVSADFVEPKNINYASLSVVDCPRDWIQVPSPSPDDPSVTATAPLNVREGPGTDFPSLGLLAPGQSVIATGQKINEKNELWYQVIVNSDQGTLGWVSGEYVTVKNGELIPEVD